MRPLIGITTSELRPGTLATLGRGGLPPLHELMLGTTYPKAIDTAGAQLGGGDADEGAHSPVLLGSLRGVLYVQWAKPRRPAFASVSNRNGALSAR